MQKHKIAHFVALLSGCASTFGTMYFLGQYMLPNGEMTRDTLELVLHGVGILILTVISGSIGRTTWLLLYLSIAWIIMTSDEFYFFRRFHF